MMQVMPNIDLFIDFSGHLTEKRFDQIWSNLIRFDQNMKFDQIWPNLIKGEKCKEGNIVIKMCKKNKMKHYNCHSYM